MDNMIPTVTNPWTTWLLIPTVASGWCVTQVRKKERKKRKQNKTKTKRNKAKQNKTKQDKTRQDKTKQSKKWNNYMQKCQPYSTALRSDFFHELKWETQKFACWLLSQPATCKCISGPICSDNCTCCHTEIEAADQTFHLPQSQYTDTGPNGSCTDPITATKVPVFKSLV